MGSLRVYLALVVVLGHTIGQVSIGSVFAVELFFLISGYLIANVLNLGTYGNFGSYLNSRFLRIFPLYWLILVITIIYRLITFKVSGFQNLDSTNLENALSKSTFPMLCILLVANSLIVLQDSIHFITTDGINYGLAGVTHSSRFSSLQPGILVPQAWSLSLEIYFYILAPSLLRSRRMLFSALGVSIFSITMVLFNNLGDSDPWSYRFFPSEISLFILGMLTFKYSKIIERKIHFKSVLVLYLFFLTIFRYLEINQILLKIILVSMTILLLPRLASLNRLSRFDSFLGKLSFPIYLFHFVVIQVVTSLEEYLFSKSNSYLTCLVTVVTSLILSVLSIRYFLDPIDRFRARFKSKAH